MFLSLLTMAFAGTEDLSCFEGKIRLRYGDSVTIEESSFCTNEDRTVLISKDFKKKKIKKVKTFEPTQLNPGFVACQEVGGTAEHLEFQVEGKWFELDRCLFSDKSYIDSGSLFQLRHR